MAEDVIYITKGDTVRVSMKEVLEQEIFCDL